MTDTPEDRETVKNIRKYLKDKNEDSEDGVKSKHKKSDPEDERTG